LAVRRETTPWFTKNFAAGSVDTSGAPRGGACSDGRMVPHASGRDDPESTVAPRIIAAMLLAIDIGTTTVTLGLFRAGSLVATRRAATIAHATADELELTIDGLLRLDDASFADVDAIACASVVPALTGALERIAAQRERTLIVASAGSVPIAVRVDRPGDVGADRLVNALAA